jgi:hypothetical protein
MIPLFHIVLNLRMSRAFLVLHSPIIKTIKTRTEISVLLSEIYCTWDGKCKNLGSFVFLVAAAASRTALRRKKSSHQTGTGD